MKFLAFDTSTELMSIAVGTTAGGKAQQWLHSGVGGAQASTGLIAGVLDLLQQAGITLAELDAICFGAGPGSFTGLRTACSVAQGLAFGAQLPVLCMDTLLAVAEEARHIAAPHAERLQVTSLLDARMDEMYAATFDYAGGVWTEIAGSHLVKPDHFIAPALAAESGGIVPEQLWAGNVFAVYGERISRQAKASDTDSAALRSIVALPTAAAMLRLAPALWAAGKAVPAEQALPTYIRDKVAKTTAERMAEKALAMAAANAVSPAAQ